MRNSLIGAYSPHSPAQYRKYAAPATPRPGVRNARGRGNR